jgi:hypothetical protein
MRTARKEFLIEKEFLGKGKGKVVDGVANE